MKKLKKTIIRNLIVSLSVIGLCIIGIALIQDARFVDQMQRWIVYGTIFITITIFGFYIHLNLKELKTV